MMVTASGLPRAVARVSTEVTLYETVPARLVKAATSANQKLVLWMLAFVVFLVGLLTIVQKARNVFQSLCKRSEKPKSDIESKMRWAEFSG